MSKYENFIRDYPKRLKRILDNQYETAREQGLEVTLMLAIASSGLIIPFERLRKRNNASEHPTQDRDRFTVAAERLDMLTQEKPFWESTLWPEKVGTWKRGTLALSTLDKYPDDPMGWDEIGDAERVKDNIPLESVLANIRNALAHGNIFVVPRGCREIGQIIFLQEKRGKNQNGVLERVSYTFLICSPDDFKAFMGFWFQFLEDLPLPEDVIPESTNFDYIRNEAAD